MAGYVRLSPRAAKDLTRLGKRRARVAKMVDALAQVPPPANLDVQLLRGHEPWSRARVGTLRVIFRPLAAAELRSPTGSGGRGYLVARVVSRRDLERVLKTL